MTAACAPLPNHMFLIGTAPGALDAALIEFANVYSSLTRAPHDKISVKAVAYGEMLNSSPPALH